MPDPRNITILFSSGCAIAAGVKKASLELPPMNPVDECAFVSNWIGETVGEGVAFMIIRNKRQLIPFYTSGGRLQDGDSLTVVPVTLGG